MRTVRATRRQMGGRFFCANRDLEAFTGACGRPPLRLWSGRFSTSRPSMRRGARVVDWDGLENRCAACRTVSSNLTLSASFSLKLFSDPGGGANNAASCAVLRAKLSTTGDDRYIDSAGVIRSMTDDSIVRGSAPRSPHLIENGARAVDLRVQGVPSRVFDNALRGTDFSPGSTLRNYPDGHTHINLPNERRFYAPR